MFEDNSFMYVLGDGAEGELGWRRDYEGRIEWMPGTSLWRKGNLLIF